MGVMRGVRNTVVAVVFLLSSISVYAQTAGTGALTGTVKDSSGAVMANVTVTATSADTNQARTVTTSDNGSYTIPLLLPGKYRVRFEAPGFKSVEVPAVTVVVAATGELNQALDVGAQSQVVTVTGEVVATQTTTAAIGTEITAQNVQALPLTTRNYTQILGLAAGASSAVNNASSLGKGSQNVAVNGAPATSNNFQMDGAGVQNSNYTGGTQESNGFSSFGIPSPDSIEEFKIQTSMFDAGYGRNAGANVNVVTKSGTNDYHGTLFEFFRNTDLNANDFFFNAADKTRPVLNQNQFGGVFGGAIKKDKLFYFFSYQETRQKNGEAGTGFQSNIILPPIPTGDRSNTATFQAALGAAICPGNNPGSAHDTTFGGGLQVACNGSDINPVAISILQLKNPDGSYYIPSAAAPNSECSTSKSAGSDGYQTGFLCSNPSRYTEHQLMGNFDYVINQKNTLSTRFYWASAPILNSFSCNTGGVCLPDTATKQDFINYDSVAKLVTIATNNLVNEVRFSAQRNETNNDPIVPFSNSQVGIANVTPGVDLFDLMTVTGQFAIGSSGAVDIHNLVTQWQVADQVSWTHGKNTIRFGAEIDRNTWDWSFPSISQGNLTFKTFPDFLLGLPGCTTVAQQAANCAGTNGSSLSNIYASGTTTSRAAPGGLYHYFKLPNASAFFQDDVKVSQKLTLNLGVRWDWFGFLTDRGGLESDFWPFLATGAAPLSPTTNGTCPLGALVQDGATPGCATNLTGFVVPKNFSQNIPAGVLQVSQNTEPQNNPQKLNFAPRIGFAWLPTSTDRLVVRGGFGAFYDRIPGNTLDHAAVQGVPYSATLVQSGSGNAFSSLAQPYANTPLGWTYRWADPTTLQSSNLSLPYMDPHIVTPVDYQYNLTVQYQFAPSWVLELGYVGLTGVHQAYLARPDNQPLIASVSNPVNGLTTNTVANAAFRGPYLGIAPNQLVGIGTEGNLKSNDVQATVRKSFSHGLTMQASYTYIRSFSTNPSTTPGNGVGNFNLNNASCTYCQYQLSNDYHPQRFAFNYNYELPLGNHTGFVGKIANGWAVSGVTVIQDGVPLTILDSRGGTIYGSIAGASTAFYANGMGPSNVAAPGSLLSKVTTGAYFNNAAFEVPPVSPLASDGKATDYGTVPPSIILGPGQFNWDISLSKTTKVGGIREDGTLVFRTEFYNAFNHPQLNNPSGLDFSSLANFGKITTLSVASRLIQFGLKYMF